MMIRDITLQMPHFVSLSLLVALLHNPLEGEGLPSELSAKPWEYCIVGAGPGGLQVGHFMLSEGWRYVILERSASAGSFFRKFPIHRQLISLNKRHTGRSDSEFNLRHDWNSLLGSDVAPMTNRSKQRFPHASILAEYLSDFAKKQEEQGSIFYNVNVLSLGRNGEEFILIVTRHGSQEIVHCAAVIMATGVGVPNMPSNLVANGWGAATQYADMPSSYAGTNYEEYEQFEGKRALVVGLGNAALETADALAPHVAFVHVMPGRAGKIRTPLFAHETRYVGDLRMMRASIFDSYLLKSLDGGMNGKSISAESHVLAKCGSQWCVLPLDPSKQTVIFYFHSRSSRAKRLIKTSLAGYVLGDVQAIPSENAVLFVSDPDGQEEEIVFQTARDEGRVPQGKAIRRSMAELQGVYLNRSVVKDEQLVLAISEELGTVDSPYPLIYDLVVLATGWKHDTSIYEPNAMPTIQPSGKFPVLSEEYEAVGVKNLYFAGAQGHGKDHRKAAGGFIHGFRYVARALVQMLASKRGKSWPLTQFKLTDGKAVEDLVQTLLKRVDSASGPYQMVHVLGDGIVLSCDGQSVEASYFQEMPLEYFNRRFRGRSRFFVSFGYGSQRQTYPSSINGATTFHVMLWHYPGVCTPPADASHQVKEESIAKDKDGYPKVQAKELLSLRETLHTVWNTPLVHEQVTDFIKVRMKKAVSNKTVAMLDQGKGVRLRKPSVSYSSGRWGRGEVDLLAKNVGKQTVTLHRLRPGVSAPPKLSAQPRDGLDEISSAEADVLTLLPGEGKRLFTEEKERWAATRNNQIVERMTVDCAYGVVQDWLIGGVKKRRSEQSRKSSGVKAKCSESQKGTCTSKKTHQ